MQRRIEALFHENKLTETSVKETLKQYGPWVISLLLGIAGLWAGTTALGSLGATAGSLLKTVGDSIVTPLTTAIQGSLGHVGGAVSQVAKSTEGVAQAASGAISSVANAAEGTIGHVGDLGKTVLTETGKTARWWAPQYLIWGPEKYSDRKKSVKKNVARVGYLIDRREYYAAVEMLQKNSTSVE